MELESKNLFTSPHIDNLGGIDMTKEDFIGFLQRASAEEVIEFIKKKGKRKMINPIIQYPEDCDKEAILKELGYDIKIGGE